ncbi:MAG: hypothetical protein WD844_15825 [Thermoleophilaceae bacterium]
MAVPNGVVVIPWVANPFRGDRFEEIWLPCAEATLRYGAHGWAFFRSKEGMLDFMQLAYFDTKLDFERYWYSEEIAAARTEAAGLFQVPVLPEYHVIAGMGSLESQGVEA